MIKKIIIGILALVIFVTSLFLAIKYDVFKSNESKLKKEDSIMMAIELFNKKFLNTKKEGVGRTILLDKLANNFILTNDNNLELLSYHYLGWLGNLNDIIELLENFKDKDATENVQEVLEFFVDFRSLADTITPLKHIYADPSDYYGKEVIIYGVIKGNDVKRKMVMNIY